MKKTIQMIIIIILLITCTNTVYATNSQVLEAQQNSLNISGFIEESKKYTEEIFPDLDLSSLFESAIKGEVNDKTILQGVFNLFGKELKSTIKTLASILIIVVIHSIFKSVSENLRNKGISQITYYVQYILIVTIIMSNFTDIIKMTTIAINDLVSFMYMLIPLLITLIITTGNIVSANVMQPILLFAITFIGNVIANLIMPIMMVSTIFTIVSNISSQVQVDKISSFFKSGVTWALRYNVNSICGFTFFRGNIK